MRSDSGNDTRVGVEEVGARGEGAGDREFARALAAERVTVADLRRHVVGPVVSFSAHAVLLLLLSSMVVSKGPEELAPDIDATVTTREIKPCDPPPPPPPPVEDAPDVDQAVVLDRPSQIVRPEDTEVIVPDVSMDAPEIVVDMPQLSNIVANRSALTIPVEFRSRRGQARAAALNKYLYSGAKTEASVSKALEWLAKNQNADGSWGVYEGTKIQYTSLALLAFLGHGETPTSERYGKTIITAIGKLLSWVERYKDAPGGTPSSGYTYNHPALVYALAEAYGMTHMPKIKNAMNAMIDTLFSGHNTHGGYWPGYARKVVWPRRDALTGELPRREKGDFQYYSDIGFTVWNCQALKAAFAAECDIAGLDETVRTAARGLKHIAKTGETARDFGSECMLALALGFLGEGDSRESRQAIAFLKKENSDLFDRCDWRYNEALFKKYPKAFTNAVFVWYWQTQAVFQITKGKGELWRGWVQAFTKSLVREQDADGSWSTPAAKNGERRISENLSAEWPRVVEYRDEKDLRLYSTVYCCLTLEVFYRYLPTYKLETMARRGVDKPAKNEDLGLRVM